MTEAMTAVRAVSLGLRLLWGQRPGLVGKALGLALMALAAVVFGIIHIFDRAVLAQRSEKFSRLLHALVVVAVAVGTVGLALKLPEVRPSTFAVVPTAFVVAAVGHLALRKVLHRRGESGACIREVPAVGTEDVVANLIVGTQQAPHHGSRVTGACTSFCTGINGGPSILHVLVLDNFDPVAAITGDRRYRVASVAQPLGRTLQRLHHMGRDLKLTGVGLLVDPGLLGIVGPRLHVAAVPFLRLTKPGFICVSLVVKGVIDRFRAALLLLLIASVMIARAIAARSDGRPSFYCQGQVSKRGEFLPVIKFLSMVLNTDQPRSELAKYTKFAGRLFKLGRPEDDRGRQIPAQVLG